MSVSAKGKQQKQVRQLQCQEQCIAHIPYYLLGFVTCTFFPTTGVDPGFFLGGGALISCSTSTPINHIVLFFLLQNTSCIRKPQVISGRGAHPLHPPPRSAPGQPFSK